MRSQLCESAFGVRFQLCEPAFPVRFQICESAFPMRIHLTETALPSYIRLTEAALPPRIRLREPRLHLCGESREVELIEFLELSLRRGVHCIQQLHQLIRDILAERVVELFR